jgi:NADH dehydrogenase [ubiquinone] 1 alpha subcomplex assembly factor 1
MTIELFDFSDPRAADAWRAIDDRVMGGVSRSRLRHDPAGHAVFEGEVSLAQNGGFASVRSSPGERGQAGATACLIEARGDTKQFKLSLLTDDGFDSINYQASFAPDIRQLADDQPAARHSAPASADATCRVHPRSTPHASARSA